MLDSTPVQADAPRRAWVEPIMGMPISIHIRGEEARSGWVHELVREVFADLSAADARFSPYREDSELRRLQRHELTLHEASRDLQEVERLCRTALVRTDGIFDAWGSVPGRPGVFDPTGLVKGWAVARASRWLAGMDEEGLDWAINAGGDVLARCAVGANGRDPDDGPGAAPTDGARTGSALGGARPDDAAVVSGLGGPPTDDVALAREPWQVGIEDPADRSRVLARVPVRDGAVATSGTAARGAHILDPRTGRAATEVVQATVIGPSLLWADVWATMLVALGPEAERRTPALHGTSGLLVYADGGIHRWANPV